MNTDIYVIPKDVPHEDRVDHYDKADGRPILEWLDSSTTGNRKIPDGWVLTYDTAPGNPDAWILGTWDDANEALSKARKHLASLDKPSAIEVWLRQTNMEVVCTIVHEDETTRILDVDSLSMRGAQREMTGYFIGEGYTPIGRWEDETGNRLETVRQFKLITAA